MGRIETFRELCKRFSLIKCKGKIPNEGKNWQKYCKFKRSFEEIGFRKDDNAGVATGPVSGIVLDVDHEEKFNEFLKVNKLDLPKTYTVETGSGGKHYYFSYPSDGRDYGCKAQSDPRKEKCPKTGKVFEIFDIRGLGGQVIAPGSIHPVTGKEYRVVNDVMMVELLDWLQQYIIAGWKLDAHYMIHVEEPVAVVVQEDEPQTRFLSWDGDLKTLDLPDKFYKLITEGATRGDRSESLCSVINALISRDLRDANIIQILEAYPIGEKYREKGSSKANWIKTRLKEARKFVKRKKKTSKQWTPAQVLPQLDLNRYLYVPNAGFFEYNETMWHEIGEHYVKQSLDKLIQPPQISKINAAFEYLKLHALIPRNQELNGNKSFVNLRNGIYDIKQGELLPHDRTHFSTIQIPVNFNVEAKCPRFCKFLWEIFEDEELINILQEFTGLCLVPDTQFEKAMVLVGQGANGKSTYLKVLAALVGEDNISTTAMHQLESDFHKASLYNKLLNISSELDVGEIVSSSCFKAIVSGDRISGSFKFKPVFTFYPFCRLIFAMNELPRVRDKSKGFYRRFIIIPFEKEFMGEKADKYLIKKLLGELDGIFIWAMQGRQRLLENDKFTESKKTSEELVKYQYENNPVLGFVADHCLVEPGLSVTKRELYNNYKDYCDENRYRPMSNNQFYKELRKYVNYSERQSREFGEKRERYLDGIGVSQVNLATCDRNLEVSQVGTGDFG